MPQSFIDLYAEQSDRFQLVRTLPAMVPVSGIASGIEPLDGVLGGFQDGNLILVVGPRGTGKTALALQIATHAAGLAPVLFCSPQVSGDQLVARHAASLDPSPVVDEVNTDSSDDEELDAGRVASSPLNSCDLEWASMRLGAKAAAELALTVVDTPRPQMRQLREHAEVMTRHGQVNLIVIDELDLVRTGQHATDRIDELDAAARSFKQLARDLNRPVLATLDSGPAVAAKPSLSDLRERDSATHHADVVMVLHPPAGMHPLGDVDLTIVKNRNGPLGTVELHLTRGGRFVIRRF